MTIWNNQVLSENASPTPTARSFSQFSGFRRLEVNNSCFDSSFFSFGMRYPISRHVIRANQPNSEFPASDNFPICWGFISQREEERSVAERTPLDSDSQLFYSPSISLTDPRFSVTIGAENQTSIHAHKVQYLFELFRPGLSDNKWILEAGRTTKPFDTFAPSRRCQKINAWFPVAIVFTPAPKNWSRPLSRFREYFDKQRKFGIYSGNGSRSWNSSSRKKNRRKVEGAELEINHGPRFHPTFPDFPQFLALNESRAG